jgi:(R,R)-butanediol dehydrogenase/meso-butanediol dehydrogenase/diacetyl reductase
MMSQHFFQIPPGTVMGHEHTGEVVALGKQVERFKVGDRVSGMAATGCGACEACFRGMGLLCTQRDGGMGGFGEYLRMPAGTAAKLPHTLSTADGALVEPMAIGLHGVRMADMPMGAKVLVLGAGSVGLAATFWARRLGAARVVTASRSVTRKTMAIAMGADTFVQIGEGEVERVIEALGGPPEIVFECAGAVGLLSQAINHVKLFGQIVSLGFCTAPDPIIPAIATFKQVRISFPLAYTPGEFQYVADMMLAGTIDPKTMITLTVTLDELPATMDMLLGPNTQTKVQVILAGP